MCLRFFLGGVPTISTVYELTQRATHQLKSPGGPITSRAKRPNVYDDQLPRSGTCYPPLVGIQGPGESSLSLLGFSGNPAR